MDMPTALASQCVEVTTPKVPLMSGRVVKGAGLAGIGGKVLKNARRLDHRIADAPTWFWRWTPLFWSIFLRS
jgi:hypothetical protein